MSSIETYQNEAVLSELQKARGTTIRLPSQIKFELFKDHCGIFMPTDAVCSNLQRDCSAFDGWAPVLKAWLGRNIVLDWEPSVDASDPHYQRFLYRAIRFNESADWFRIGEHSGKYLEASVVLDPSGGAKKPGGYFLVNVPGKREEIEGLQHMQPLKQMSENELERLFFTNPRVLLVSIGFDERARIMRQMPVGVFAGEVSGGTRVFPGLGGKVDLGAVEDGKKVALFELKKPGNAKVGAISELLFYSHVVRDIQMGIFEYDRKKRFENASQIREAPGVAGFILSDRLNGSIDNEELFSVLNKSFSIRKETFGYVAYQELRNTIACRRVF